jgi:hypothetical protein
VRAAGGIINFGGGDIVLEVTSGLRSAVADPVKKPTAQKLGVWTLPYDQHQRPPKSHGIYTGNIRFCHRPGHLLSRLWSAVPADGSR